MDIIPKPTLLTPNEGRFDLTHDTRIYVTPASVEAMNIGEYLGERLRPATGFALPATPTASAPSFGHIYLSLIDTDAALGEEGYALRVGAEGVTLTAHRPAGLFRGIQTLRQMLPPAIEQRAEQPGPWSLPGVEIRDVPRFSWRGAMLDVSRHFFGVEDVKRYIDHLAYYKVNRFHLHLSDDQGWRIEIKAWPKLTEIGGSTQVGGGPGGFFTQEQYAEIVRYAQSRYIVVVPEIDMPGHTMAALASYPELSREGIMPSLYTGTDVGMSSLNTRSNFTYQFIEDVIREIAELTPGPFIHIGGDEAYKTSEADYVAFIERVQGIIERHGKIMVGWEEIAKARLLPQTVVQFWRGHPSSMALARRAVEQGARIIMSPASRAYLDMKYDRTTPLGHTWAGFVEVQTAYEWDPVGMNMELVEDNIIGVEAPLWSETARTLDDAEYLAFPRLAGINEIGWSCAAGRTWEEYRGRLAAHGPRFAMMGIDFYRSPQVIWPV
ncbi:MAG: beta-N-acetylhexosaminidase [Anaerolineae bacterium]|jgi:hexosaminidase|nr:beta-N-acetylhexosaminidase [Anaerolineae bacterium]